MTVYVLKYTDQSNTNGNTREAFSSYEQARKRYQELNKEAKDNDDLMLHDINDSITKHAVKNQSDLIDLINKL